uniref:Uncharacterized protein n=1 Tax=Meloidogyne enterolobii TaxID=390850 RepID=A0A6V7V7L4_MELEN|nr:unnamed protein product [Meloidogyne enterolobii]
MDRLAACHALYGFMQLPGSKRGRHSSAPNCQNVKRSLSLADRRGIISPGRGNGRGFISPLPITRRRASTKGSDEWDDITKLHGKFFESKIIKINFLGPHSFSRLRGIGLLMHALGGPGQVFISAAAMDLGRGGAKVPPTNLSYGRKKRRIESLARRTTWATSHIIKIFTSRRAAKYWCYSCKRSKSARHSIIYFLVKKYFYSPIYRCLVTTRSPEA